jgi:hypothetical protein
MDSTTFHQDVEPHGETIRIELFVQPRLTRPPQVEIEHTLQLVRRCQRDEIAAILEAAGLYDPVQQLRLQVTDHMPEVRRLQNAIEQSTLVAGEQRYPVVDRPRPAIAAPVAAQGAPSLSAATTNGFLHGTGDDTGTGAQQTVLNDSER